MSSQCFFWECDPASHCLALVSFWDQGVRFTIYLLLANFYAHQNSTTQVMLSILLQAWNILCLPSITIVLSVHFVGWIWENIFLSSYFQAVKEQGNISTEVFESGLSPFKRIFISKVGIFDTWSPMHGTPFLLLQHRAESVLVCNFWSGITLISSTVPGALSAFSGLNPWICPCSLLHHTTQLSYSFSISLCRSE